MNDPIPVYGGLYFTSGEADQYCDGMNGRAGVPKCSTGAPRLDLLPTTTALWPGSSRRRTDGLQG